MCHRSVPYNYDVPASHTSSTHILENQKPVVPRARFPLRFHLNVQHASSIAVNKPYASTHHLASLARLLESTRSCGSSTPISHTASPTSIANKSSCRPVTPKYCGSFEGRGSLIRVAKIKAAVDGRLLVDNRANAATSYALVRRRREEIPHRIDPEPGTGVK